MSSIKDLLKKVVSHIVSHDLVWWIFRFFIVKPVHFIEYRRYELEDRQLKQDKEFIQEAIVRLTPDLTVQNGPFQGMKYPEASSAGSALYPKLLGSYEKELHQILKSIIGKKYRSVVNIGCGEGYYSVGLAIANRETVVQAYDTDTAARDLCRKMADLNGVGNRVRIGGRCTPDLLVSLPFLKKGTLIFCDCEGYEKELFTEVTAPILKHVDLLIEVHDFLDIEISCRMKKVFEKSHSLRVVSSVDDIKKAQSYRYSELRNYSLLERKILLAEERPSIMEWYFMSPR